MNIDIDGASRAARLAADFDWTWYVEDIPRFCSVAGWEIARSDDLCVELKTDIRVQRPEFWVYPRKRILERLAPTVADLAEDELAWLEVRRQVVDGFAVLAVRLAADLGAPVRAFPGVHAKVGWDRPNVAINLCSYGDLIVLEFASPEYQESLSEGEA